MSALPGANEASFRRANRGDLPAVEALLAAYQLPTAGVAQSIEGFWLAEGQGAIVGVAGLELLGGAALLRSVVVTGEWRGRGLAGKLVERVLETADHAGASAVYLLTTTAEQFFPRFGFHPIARVEAPPSIQASVEFREACPASAVCLVKPLTAVGRS